MAISKINRQTEKQVIKALNRSALIFFAARIFYLIVYGLIHLWALAALVFFSALLWYWIYHSTKSSYTDLSFYLGVVESVIFALVSTAALGWNSGAFFWLIVLLPLILINTKIKKEVRLFQCAALIVLLLVVYAASQILHIDSELSEFSKNLLFAMNMLAGCFVLAMVTFTEEELKLSSQEEIVHANEQLMTLANTDPLTNLLNRRIMMEKLQEEKDRVEQTGLPFSLIMLDIDNFKQINDEYGHDCGDFVLVALTEKLRASLRKNDLISRWGGDEFLLMLPEATLHDAEIIGEKIRQRVVNSPFFYHEADIPVTVTLGVSQCDRSSGIGSSIRQADLALYKGKQGGKNRLASIS